MTMKLTEGMLVAAMSAHLDPVMASHGFTRNDDSMEYSRVTSEAAQSVQMTFDHRPSYEPRAVAHWLPAVAVWFPEVSRVLHDMLGGDVSLMAHAPDVTFRIFMPHLAPKGTCEPWYVYDEASARHCISSIRDFATTWALPFLDDYSSVLGFICGYERDDDRLQATGRLLFLHVAAAYVVLKNPDQAMHVLEHRFGKAMLRRKYAAAFEYVANLLRAGPRA